MRGQVVQSGGGSRELIAEVTTSAKVATVTISSLNIAIGERYVLESFFKNDDNSSYLNMFINNNVIATNYASADARSTSALSHPAIGRIPTRLYYGFYITEFRVLPNGYLFYTSNGINNISNVLNEGLVFHGGARFTVSSVTRLDLKSSGAGGILADSTFKLYKIN